MPSGTECQERLSAKWDWYAQVWLGEYWLCLGDHISTVDCGIDTITYNPGSYPGQVRGVGAEQVEGDGEQEKKEEIKTKVLGNLWHDWHK